MLDCISNRQAVNMHEVPLLSLQCDLCIISLLFRALFDRDSVIIESVIIILLARDSLTQTAP